MRGISIRHLESLFTHAQEEHEKHVRLERRELDLIIRELKHGRSRNKKLRLKRNKQQLQILNLAAKVREVHQ